MTSLERLGSLTTIGNLGLTIHSNAVLSTLNGLDNLRTLSRKLFIGTTNGTTSSPNAALIAFYAISQLVTGTPQITTTEYFVANNKYNPLYTGLASSMVETVAGTNNGCAELGTVVVSTNTFSKEEDYRLFPNPITDVLFVKSESKITSITQTSFIRFFHN